MKINVPPKYGYYIRILHIGLHKKNKIIFNLSASKKVGMILIYIYTYLNDRKIPFTTKKWQILRRKFI